MYYSRLVADGSMFVITTFVFYVIGEKCKIIFVTHICCAFVDRTQKTVRKKNTSIIIYYF